MSLHTIRLSWSRGDAPFERNNYSRDHSVLFQGGQRLAASSAADYGGNPAHADPEQLLLSALSSCHMLTFLAVAANRGYVVESYVDAAEAELGKDAEGRTAVGNELMRLRTRYPSLKMPRGMLGAMMSPPASPGDCTFARTTDCLHNRA